MVRGTYEAQTSLDVWATNVSFNKLKGGIFQ